MDFPNPEIHGSADRKRFGGTRFAVPAASTPGSQFALSEHHRAVTPNRRDIDRISREIRQKIESAHRNSAFFLMNRDPGRPPAPPAQQVYLSGAARRLFVFRISIFVRRPRTTRRDQACRDVRIPWTA
jgi:hypothetical protein